MPFGPKVRIEILVDINPLCPPFLPLSIQWFRIVYCTFWSLSPLSAHTKEVRSSRSSTAPRPQS